MAGQQQRKFLNTQVHHESKYRIFWRDTFLTHTVYRWSQYFVWQLIVMSGEDEIWYTANRLIEDNWRQDDTMPQF